MFKQKISSQSLMIICILVSYILIFFEWLFQVTKPSFMSVLPLLEKIKVFLGFGSLFAIAVLLMILPVLLLNTLPGLKARKQDLNLVGSLVPAAMLASLSLLLVDDFTYTLFGFGIYKTVGLVRAAYALLFLVTLFIFWREINKAAQKIGDRISKFPGKKQKAIMVFLILFLVLPLAFIFTDDAFARKFDKGAAALNKDQHPNIIVFTADGLDASHLSLYGYERDTTPFLRSIADVSLIAENDFPNSLKTAGSITSLLTGKYPTTTRVLFPPDILRGEDAYQHLPGILRNAGYYSAQFGHKYFVDAYQFNLLNGFDEVNSRSFQKNPVFSKFSSALPDNYAFFAYEVANRLVDRIRHIFFIKEMQNPFVEVTAAIPQNFHDDEKIRNTLNLLDTLNQPLFVHIHWMGTHGARYAPVEQVFSAGRDPESQEMWDTDFYDDAILEFDRAIAGLMDELAKRELDKNTVIIVTSDHGQDWANKRLPLIIKFPQGAFSKLIQPNVQNLDIAPTLLDYLGIAIPDWMAGQSLISESYQPYPVISAAVAHFVNNERNVESDPKKIKPPFYQFDEISVIDCQKIYQLNLEKYAWTMSEVEDYTSKCADEDLLTPGQVAEIIKNRLSQDGFELPEGFPPRFDN